DRSWFAERDPILSCEKSTAGHDSGPAVSVNRNHLRMRFSVQSMAWLSAAHVGLSARVTRCGGTYAPWRWQATVGEIPSAASFYGRGLLQNRHSSPVTPGRIAEALPTWLMPPG